MKKLVLFAAVAATIALASCGKKAEEAAATDTLAADSMEVVADTAAAVADTTVADSAAAAVVAE